MCKRTSHNRYVQCMGGNHRGSNLSLTQESGNSLDICHGKFRACPHFYKKRWHDLLCDCGTQKIFL